VTPARGAGVRNKDGVLVSLVDGRPLVSNNSLRRTYPSTFRCSSNTRRWNGHKLDLGQAFKLASWTHYGPRLPTEKSGDFETRKALFRTAAYYSMSMDGSDEAECLDSPDLAEFLFILVQNAKQMRYSIITEGRVFFGDNVFFTMRALQKYQREFYAFYA
jgi:hypothetical protein